MIGTITNTGTIIVGSLAGAALGNRIPQLWRKVMFEALGLASIALGINAVCQSMPRSEHPVLFVVSLALGGLAGTAINLDGRMKRLVDRLQLRGKALSDNDRRPRLAEGLTTATLLYCIGTLSILGPINSALLGDETYLFTNASLDFVSSIFFAATYGAGMALAAPLLFCWQGSIYLLAKLCGDFIPQPLLIETGTIGGTLIIASGLTILGVKDCKTLNLIPSLLVPPLYLLARALL